MKDDRSHVIVTFDPTKKVLTVSHSADVSLDDHLSNKIIDIPVADLLSRDASDVLTAVGSAVLETFEHMREQGIGLSHCIGGSGEGAIEHAFETIEQRAMNGDASSQNALASKYLSDSMGKLDPGLLDQAEKWFKAAADNGYSPAGRFLQESWADIKKAYKRRIEERRGQEGQA